jgi:hypothetical protein
MTDLQRRVRAIACLEPKGEILLSLSLLYASTLSVILNPRRT